MTKTDVNIASHFSAGDSLSVIHQTPAIYRGSLKKIESNLNLVFSPSRSDVVVQSSRSDEFIGNREIYNLNTVSRPVLFKITGTNWICILFGVNKNEKKN